MKVIESGLILSRCVSGAIHTGPCEWINCKSGTPILELMGGRLQELSNMFSVCDGIKLVP